eukprot:403340076
MSYLATPTNRPLYIFKTENQETAFHQLRLAKEEGIMRRSMENFMRDTQGGHQSPQRDIYQQDQQMLQAQQNTAYPIQFGGNSYFRDSTQNSNQPKVFGQTQQNAVKLRYQSHTRPMSPLKSTSIQQNEVIERSKPDQFGKTMQSFHTKQKNRTRSIKPEFSTLVQNNANDNGFNTQDKGESNQLMKSQSSQVLLQTQDRYQKPVMDATTLYPSSPLSRLYRNNIKVQMGRQPVQFFKKVYTGNQSPNCAQSKINMPGNTTMANFGTANFHTTQQSWKHKQTLSPLKRQDFGSKLLSFNPENPEVIKDQHNKTQTTHTKFFHDYFGQKDRGKKQLNDQLPDVRRKNSRDFNILSNVNYNPGFHFMMTQTGGFNKDKAFDQNQRNSNIISPRMEKVSPRYQ